MRTLTILLVLHESGTLEARASIPESQLALLRVGDAATLRIEGIAAPIETTISAVGDSIDPATRTYSVRMPVANEDHALKAGVFALVEIVSALAADPIPSPASNAIATAGARSLDLRDSIAHLSRMPQQETTR